MKKLHLLTLLVSLFALTLILAGCAGDGVGFGGTGGGGGGGGASAFTISGSTSNATVAVNGDYSGAVAVDKFTTPFTLGGVTYDGQYSIGTTKAVGSYFNLDLFGLSYTAGQSVDLATSPLGYGTYMEGMDKIWQAMSGTVTVDAISGSNMTVSFHNVVFQPQPGGMTTGTGNFTVNGTLSGPIVSH